MERIVDSEQKTQDFTINLSIFVSEFEETGHLAEQKTQDFTINLSIFVSEFEETCHLAKLIAGFIYHTDYYYSNPIVQCHNITPKKDQHYRRLEQ
jgi:hypothetical protein